MMRSLYSGVSGLKNHQTRMDVIGNNISNVNTTGFKSSRTNFSDMLSQNLSGASAPNGNTGGTNAKQIGLGSSVAAVDLLFTNGSVQSTGVNTDLALSSTNALFILDTGNSTAYTRNGDFQFDAEGNYVQAGNGYFVQGWMANNGAIDTGAQVTNITIPSGKTMGPMASTTAEYTNNLNAEVPTVTALTGGTPNTGIKTVTYTLPSDGSLTGTEEFPLRITTSDGNKYQVPEGSYSVGDKYSFTTKEPGESITVSTDASNTVKITLKDGYTATENMSGTKYTVGEEVVYTASTATAKTDGSNTVKLVLADGSKPEITGTGKTYTVGETYEYDVASATANDYNIVTAKLKDGSKMQGATGTSYAIGDSVTYDATAISLEANTYNQVKITYADDTTDLIPATPGDPRPALDLTVGKPYNSKNVKNITVTSEITGLTVKSEIKKLSVASKVDQLDVSSEITEMQQDYSSGPSGIKTKVYTKASDGPMTATEEYPVTLTGIDEKTYKVQEGTYKVGDKYSYSLTKDGEKATASTDGTNTVQYTLADGYFAVDTSSGAEYEVGKDVTYVADIVTAKADGSNSVTLTLADESYTEYPILTPTEDTVYKKGDSFTYDPGDAAVKAETGRVVTATFKTGVTLTGTEGTSYQKGGEASYNATQVELTDGTYKKVVITCEGGSPEITSGDLSLTVGQDYGAYGKITSITVTALVDSLLVTSPIDSISATSKTKQLDVSTTIKEMSQDYVASAIASADSPVTVTLSDGSKLVQTAGVFTIGSSLPVVTTLSVYDTLGSVHDVALYFTLTDPAEDTWSVALTNDGSTSTSWTEADGSITTVSMEPITLDFDTNGRFASGTGRTTLTMTNGSTTPQTVTLDLSSLTQYSASSTIAGKANGNAAGTLSSISIDRTGTITGTYTNGEKQVEAQVALQRFTNPGGLNKIGESLYEDSNNAGLSGSPNTAAALGATITPSALEMSNVDIANEFTDMIITQRGFQGNSKIITVSDEMLETLINMKR